MKTKKAEGFTTDNKGKALITDNAEGKKRPQGKIKMYGLTEQDIKWMNEAIKNFPEIEEVILFGSRAMGNYKKASDVDVCIKGSEVNEKTIVRLKDLLEEEYPLPYFFDVIDYKKIMNKELKKHIDKEGKRLY